MSGYLTVKGECENTTVIERSKFICYIKHIENEDEAKEYVEEIRKKHSFARHNCFAYIADGLGLNQKFSDAGEPQGTAGMPMLNVLKSKKIYKTVAVVARYFGGIKLGTGGLVRAYGGAVSECLKNAEIVDMQPIKRITFTTNYDEYSKIIKLVENKTFAIANTEFSQDVKMTLAVKGGENELQSFIKTLEDIKKGQVLLESVEDGFYPF